jgi:hypothetical protein
MHRYRNEFKHIINYEDYALLRLRLKSLLPCDPNVDSDGSYSVRSLYFDDYYNQAYHDKYAGVLNRSKYRIRIYNQSDQTITLEKKNKVGQYNYKQTARLTVEEVYCILQDQYDFLLRSSNHLLRIFYHECISNLMRPRVVIDYEREPLIMEAGDVRITFDRNIRAGVDGFDIFDATMPMVEVLSPGALILEVKFTEFLPTLIREVLPTKASEYTAVSKYILGCDRTMHRRFSHI